MRFSLKYKIILLNACIFIMIFSLTFFIIVNTIYSTVINKTVQYVETNLENYQEYINEYIAGENFLEAIKSLKSKSPFLCAYIGNKTSLQVEIYNTKKDLLGISFPKKVYYVYQDIYYASNGKTTYIIRKSDGINNIFMASPIYFQNEVIGCIRFVYPMKSEFELINKNLYVIVMIGILSLLLSIVISFLYAHSITRPLAKLRDKADLISEGKFEGMTEISSNDEIQDLSKSFDLMATNLDSYIKNLKEEKERQKRFVDNIAHELKTPLTSIIGYSEILPRLKDKKDFEVALGHMNAEGKRLLSLVEEMLYVSKLGRSDFVLDVEKCDLHEIIDSSVNILKPRFDKFYIKVSEKIENCAINADFYKTQEVFLNILDNCIRHSNCSKIEISNRFENGRVFVDITDDGCGIKRDDLQKIMEPFYSSKSKGSGLGLYIVKEIMGKQGGNVTITSEKDVYTRVTLMFGVKG